MVRHVPRVPVARAFTIVELLVVISLIALLVGLLLPSLAKARNAANIVKDAANMQQIGRGCGIYASDNNDYAPILGGFSHQDDAPAGNVAGANLCGSNPGGGNTSAGGISAPLNAPMGLGILIPAGAKATPPANTKFGSYIDSIDIMFSPNDRKPTRLDNNLVYPSFYVLRDWFGDTRANNWTKEGLTWGYWSTAANYHLDSSYSYRGGDYSWYDPAVHATRILSYQLSPVSSGGTPTTANLIKAKSNARQSSPYWARKSILMNTDYKMLDSTKEQVNVMTADYSVHLESNAQYLDHYFGRNGYTSPQNWYAVTGYLHSKRFALLDYYNGY